MSNNRRRAQRLSRPPQSPQQRSRELQVREQAQRFEQLSREHTEHMIEEHGGEWVDEANRLYEKWKDMKEEFGENSIEARRAGQAAGLWRREGKKLRETY